MLYINRGENTLSSRVNQAIFQYVRYESARIDRSENFGSFEKAFNEDNGLKRKAFAFGFQTKNNHFETQTKNKVADTICTVGSYIPIFGALFVLCMQNKSKPERIYRQINSYKAEAFEEGLKACGYEEKLKSAEGPRTNLVRQLKVITIYEDVKKNLEHASKPEKDEIEVISNRKKQFERLLAQKEDGVMEESESIQEQAELQNEEELDKLLLLQKAVVEAERGRQTKLSVLKEKYPGIEEESGGSEIELHLRMALSFFVVGVVVLPIIDLIATGVREYRAYKLNKNRISLN